MQRSINLIFLYLFSFPVLAEDNVHGTWTIPMLGRPGPAFLSKEIDRKRYRIDSLSKETPAVKEAVIVCMDYERSVLDACQNLKAVFDSCGVKAHVILDIRSLDRYEHAKHLAPDLSTATPVFILAHGSVDPSRPHRITINKERGKKESELTSNVIDTYRSLFPNNPVFLNSCGSGNCISAYSDSNMMGMCAADTEGTAMYPLGPLVKKFYDIHLPTITNLLCSKKKFLEISKGAKEITGKQLEEIYLKEPLYKYWEKNNRKYNVSPNEKERKIAFENELCGKLKKDCPDADKINEKCLEQGYQLEKCPKNYVCDVSAKDTFLHYVNYKAKEFYTDEATHTVYVKDSYKEYRNFITENRFNERVSNFSVPKDNEDGGDLHPYTAEQSNLISGNPSVPENCGHHFIYPKNSYVHRRQAFSPVVIFRENCEFEIEKKVKIEVNRSCATKTYNLEQIRKNKCEFPTFSPKFRLKMD